MKIKHTSVIDQMEWLYEINDVFQFVMFYAIMAL